MGGLFGATAIFLSSVVAFSADLESLRVLQLSGFDTEPELVQEHLIRQAELYRNYRRGKDKEAYHKDCANEDKLPKPFCQLEQGRLLGSITRKLIRLENRRSKRSKISTKNLLKLDEKELAKLSSRDIRTAVNHLKNYKDIEALAQKTVSNNSCVVGPVAFGLAIKVEEKFPEKKWVELTEKLYRQSAGCLKGEDQAYARFRAGLMTIWARGCEGVPEWFEPIITEPGVGEGMQVRARYWQHYCGTVLGNKNLVKLKKEELKTIHPMSFHNLLVNREAPLAKHDKDATKVLFRSQKKTNLNLLAQAMETLLQVEAPNDWLGELASVEVSELAESESEFQIYIAALLERAQQGLAKFKVLGQLLLNHPESVVEASLKMYFPIWYFDIVQKHSAPVDPFLVMGLIRQESAFNPRAQSPAGARGLMQVMPYTARSYGVRQKKNLFDPDTSVRVGSKFLYQRLRQFLGDVELTLASYNAGPARVNEWVQRYPVDQRMLFLDLIPYKETRDYVTLILRNYLWYTKMYAGKNLYNAEERKLAEADSTFALKFTALSQEETLSAR